MFHFGTENAELGTVAKPPCSRGQLQHNNKFQAMKYNPSQQGGEACSSSPCGGIAPNATRGVSRKWIPGLLKLQLQSTAV